MLLKTINEKMIYLITGYAVSYTPPCLSHTVAWVAGTIDPSGLITWPKPGEIGVVTLPDIVGYRFFKNKAAFSSSSHCPWGVPVPPAVPFKAVVFLEPCPCLRKACPKVGVLLELQFISPAATAFIHTNKPLLPCKPVEFSKDSCPNKMNDAVIDSMREGSWRTNFITLNGYIALLRTC